MSERPQNRNLRPNPENLGVEPNPEGYMSRSHNIKATRAGHEWFAGLTSGERGLVVDMAYDMIQDGELTLERD